MYSIVLFICTLRLVLYTTILRVYDVQVVFYELRLFDLMLCKYGCIRASV